MGKKSIQLGDEIIDVTSKTSGIAIGKVEYLSGAKYWIIQPTTTDDNVMIKQEYVPDAYCEYVSPGVYPKPAKVMGFHAREVERNGSQSKKR